MKQADILTRVRQRHRLSYLSAAFIPCYFIFCSLILLDTRGFSDAAESPLGLTNIHRVMSIWAALVVIVSYLVLRGVPRPLPTPLILFGCYLLVGLISSVIFSSWPLFSLFKLGEVTAGFLLGIYILRMNRRFSLFAFETYELTLGFFKFLILSVLIGTIVMPQTAIHAPISDLSMQAYGEPILPYQISGWLIQVNPNSLGTMSAVLLYVNLVRLLRNRSAVSPTRIFWTFVAAATLVFSQSRVAWAGFLLALGANVILSSGKARLKGTLVVMVLLVFAAGVGDTAYRYITRGWSSEQLANLSGRSANWEKAVNEFTRADPASQLFGLGYMVANRDILSNVLDADSCSTLHSDYVDALIGNGYLGACLLFLSVAALLRNCVNAVSTGWDSGWATELAGCATIIATRSVFNPTISSHTFFVVLFIVVVVSVHVLRYKRIEGRLPRDPRNY